MVASGSMAGQLEQGHRSRVAALVKTRLKRMQYRPGLCLGSLAGTGLDLADPLRLQRLTILSSTSSRPPRR